MTTLTIHSISLSTNLRLFLAYADYKGRDEASDGRGTLGIADSILERVSDEELETELPKFSQLDGFEDFDSFGDETFLVGTTPMNVGRNKLNQEFFALLDEWGPLYPIEHLLNADQQNLSTQMAVKDIVPGFGFEIDDHPRGDGDVVVQFKRVDADPSIVPTGKVLYEITYGSKNNKVQSMDEDTMVRPLFREDYGQFSTGSSFDDPERYVELKAAADEYREVSDAMDDKIEAALKADGQTKNVLHYSAYKSKLNGTPIDNLDEIAVEGRVVLFQLTDYGPEDAQADFEDEPYTDFESEVLENPTWLDVSVQANRMISTVGDYHHIFLEGLYLNKKLTAKRDDDVKVYTISMGS